MAWRELGGRGVSGAVVHARMHIMRPGLSHASGCHILIAFVDGVLHLLKELIDVDQIVLGPNIGHGGKVVARSLATRAVAAATDRNRRGNLLIFGHRAVENGELEGLQTQQTLADRGVRVRIELTAFQIPKKLIQRVVATLTVVRVSSILSLAQGIVNIAVRMRIGGLRRRVWLVVLWRWCMGILAIDAIDGAFKVMCCGGVTLRVLWEHHIRMLHPGLGRTNLGVIGMGLDMLLQILGALECLAAEITFMRLQRHMNSNVGGDVISLDCGSIAGAPLAGQVEVISALSSHMALANMLLEHH